MSVYGIFVYPEHPTDPCPTLQGGPLNVDLSQAYATNIYNFQPATMTDTITMIFSLTGTP